MKYILFICAAAIGLAFVAPAASAQNVSGCGDAYKETRLKREEVIICCDMKGLYYHPRKYSYSDLLDMGTNADTMTNTERYCDTAAALQEWAAAKRAQRQMKAAKERMADKHMAERRCVMAGKKYDPGHNDADSGGCVGRSLEQQEDIGGVNF